MGLLDKLLSNESILAAENGIIRDTSTQYNSPWVSGTPTNTANPGPVTNFVKVYSPSNQYANNTNSQLSDTLQITNLDIENPGVNGGIPYKPQNDPTVYPTSTNGSTPIEGYFPTIGKPAVKYGSDDTIHKSFSPSNTYLEYIKPFTQ